MPRIETEFEFDMVVCFGISLAPYAVSIFHIQHIARPVEIERPINTVFVRPSIRPSLVSL